MNYRRQANFDEDRMYFCASVISGGDRCAAGHQAEGRASPPWAGRMGLRGGSGQRTGGNSQASVLAAFPDDSVARQILERAPLSGTTRANEAKSISPMGDHEQAPAQREVDRRKDRKRSFPPMLSLRPTAPVLLAAALAVLLVFFFPPMPSLSQLSSLIPQVKSWVLGQGTAPDLGDFIGGVAVLGLIGLFAGAFCWAGLRLASLLSGRDLAEVFNGNEPFSLLWLYILVIGVFVGAGAAVVSVVAISAWSSPT